MTTLAAGKTQNAPLWRIGISPKAPDLDAQGAAVLRDIHELGLTHVRRVAFSRLFLLEGNVPSPAVKRIAGELLADSITEIFSYRGGGDDLTLPGPGFDAAIEVHLKGGVMDPVAASTLAAIADMGAPTAGLAISTARLYRLAGVASIDELTFIARRLLSNDCIEDVYLTGFGRHDPRPDHLPVAPSRQFELRHISIRELDERALMKLSREGHLFLSLPEMRAIQDHYRRQRREPTDLELETFAQTWSEHCVHKTLKSAVRYRGEPMPLRIADCGLRNTEDERGRGGEGARGRGGESAACGVDEVEVEINYDNLLRDTIARATRELIDSGRVDWCLSVFEDNAGIIAFDRDYGIAFKAETHNHPSAIEPYGGAATGVRGCIRDIMGCGLGAKPIANTDVFCVADPDFPMAALPKGVLHPRRVLKGVVAGVRDYGNRMGIPTINGAIVFDNRYLGNPLVFCGCVGLIPRDRIHKGPRPGDFIVLMGGRTGRDGIHGATFSSAELTDTHADEFSHAVQIGNAITEKQVLDAMLAARDHASGCLYTAVTDCGAGGLSSAVGEMGSKLGANVDLEKVPLKYSGLRYDEIWISEAQERMVLSVPPANWPALRAICDAENVEATVIGTFRDDGKLLVKFAGQTVGEIDAEFLHEGIPKTTKEASWETRNTQHSALSTQHSVPMREMLLERLSSLNVASKEWVIRQYDHEVQGRSVIKPLVGPGNGPSDAAVIRPRLDSSRGIAIGNGICPQLSDVDPYWMAVAAIDEAIRNVVCVGGDPRRTAILDNFCWGNCDDPQTMGALVRACQGCYDAAMAYGTPFISGKDSLNNEFALDPADAQHLAGIVPLHNNRIRIPGTLLISAVSMIDEVRKCVTMDAKPIQGTRFYFVGSPARSWQEINLNKTAALHFIMSKLIAGGDVLAAHDVSDGGILSALAEMALAGQCGIDINFASDWPDLLSPVPSGYILQTSSRLRLKPADIFKTIQLGQPQQGPRLSFRGRRAEAFSIDLSEIAAAWRSSLNW